MTGNMNKKKAIGALGSILAKQDKKKLERTRNRMLLAMKIEIAMREKGFSQKQFAAKMGKTESEISEWLSGDRNFTIDTLSDIEMALDIRLFNTHCMNTVQFPAQMSYKTTKKRDDVVGLNSDKKDWTHIEKTDSYKDKFLMVG